MRPTPDKMRAFLAQLKTKMNLRSLVVTLAAIVVFTTTYLLVLPAFTLEKEEAMEQGGIDIAAEQTVEIVDEEAPAEQAEKPAADADAEASVESVTDEETVVQENKAPAENNTDSKPEAADTKADSKPETVNTKADSKPETVNTEADDKQEVKLLTRKTTLTAEKAKGADFEVSAVVGKAAKVPEDTMLQATELTKDTEGFDYDKYYDEALKALKADSGDTMTIKSIKFYDISLESETQEESVEPKSTVNVKIAYEEGIEVEDADSVRVVHFTENSKGKVVPEVLDKKENKVETVVDTKESKLTEASFDTDGFSKYAIVETEIEKYVLASDGHKYRITATYGPETGIPGDADLEVEEILSTSKEYAEYVSKTENALGMEEDSAEYIRLFDISIVDKNNSKIKYQPKKGTAVDVRIELDDSSSKDLSVVHFADENSTGDVVDSSKHGQAVEFEASGFSVYAVIEGQETDARMAMEFHVMSADGQTDNLVATMYVKKSDSDEALELIIYDPSIGSYIQSGEIFRGWTFKKNYTVKDATTTYNATTAPNGAMTIDDIRAWAKSMQSSIEETDPITTYKFYAIILKNFTVQYLDPDGDAVATDSAYMLRSDTEATYTIEQSYTAPGDDYKFEGWIIKDAESLSHVTYTGTTPLEQISLEGHTYDLYKLLTPITLKGDATFHAYVPYGHWLIFDEVEKGATYTAARFLKPGDTTSLPTKDKMSLLGYQFAGWYTDKNYAEGTLVPGTDTATASSPVQYSIDDKTFLYAKWVPVDWAPYTVVIWQENLDQPDPANKQYSYTESVRCWGPVGEKITIGDSNDNSAMLSLVDNNDADYLYVYGQNEDKSYVTYDKKATHSRTAGTSNVVHTYTNEDYVGFNCVRFENEDGDKITNTTNSVEINPEGNSIVNVYYDRITYKVKIYFASTATPDGSGYHLYHYRAGTDDTPLGPDHMDNRYYYDVNDFPFTGDYQQETVNGVTYYYTTITARYGADISDQWPKYTEFNNATVRANGGSGQQAVHAGDELTMISWYMSSEAAGYRGKGSGLNTFKGIITIMDEKILGDISVAEDRDNTSVRNYQNILVTRYDPTVYYYKYEIWKEQLEDVDYSSYETRTKTINGKEYNFFLSEDDCFVAHSSATTGEKATQAPVYRGFENLSKGSVYSNPAADNSETKPAVCEFYYERIKNPIIYRDGSYFNGENQRMAEYAALGTDAESAPIYYEASIASYGKGGANYKTDYPSSYAGFVFDGWYMDAECSTPYPFESTIMPDHSITVYAKFQQIQYRVFLHSDSIADKVPDGVTPYWGDNQGMNFRVDYEERVSTPTGELRNSNGTLYDEYTFGGWFLDPNFQRSFDSDAYPVTEAITSPYDRKTNLTDNMNTFGLIDGNSPTPTGETGPGYNSDDWKYDNGAFTVRDGKRWWITEKLDLYARWDKNLHESNIEVQYDLNGGTYGNPSSTGPIHDPTTYKDNADAIAMSAPNPPEAQQGEKQKVFRYWVLQMWDEDAGKYVDLEHLKFVSPTDTFVVKHEYAREEIVNPGESNEYKKYTVQLRAEYDVPGEKTPTHIWWYQNYGSNEENAASVEKTNHIYIDGSTPPQAVVEFGINQAVLIKPENTFTRSGGYEFLGWARVNSTDDQGNPLSDEPKVHPELGVDDLYLKYVKDNSAAGGHFEAKNKAGVWVTVTEVAADEVFPYHNMYAVWRLTVPVKVIKEDQKGNALEGAKFKFTSKNFNGDQDDNTYTSTIAQGGTDAVIVESGSVEAGTYVISETDAPDGYNKMDKPVSITVAASQAGGLEVTVSYEGSVGSVKEAERIDVDHPELGWKVTICNDAGIELPNTGGIGTTIFYILGSLLVVGCGIVLVSRRRMKNK